MPSAHIVVQPMEPVRVVIYDLLTALEQGEAGEGCCIRLGIRYINKPVASSSPRVKMMAYPPAPKMTGHDVASVLHEHLGWRCSVEREHVMSGTFERVDVEDQCFYNGMRVVPYAADLCAGYSPKAIHMHIRTKSQGDWPYSTDDYVTVDSRLGYVNHNLMKRDNVVPGRIYSLPDLVTYLRDMPTIPLEVVRAELAAPRPNRHRLEYLMDRPYNPPYG